MCQFRKEKVLYADYKDTTLPRKFISARAKIRVRCAHDFYTRTRATAFTAPGFSCA